MPFSSRDLNPMNDSSTTNQPEIPRTFLQMRTTVHEDGRLVLSLEEVETRKPRVDEVLVKVQAAPINPSDLGLLFGLADMKAATSAGTDARPVVTAPIAEHLMPFLSGRVDQSLAVGNEGAGLVVAAGEAPEAQALLGRTVAMVAGAMYAQYRCHQAKQVLPLEPGTTAREGASCFVNPLTALGMVETMKLEGHSALVHTAAASNLGQMLNRICQTDGVELVNIVRKKEQAKLLHEQGAAQVCNSADADFDEQLTKALIKTGATIAFDAIGGGDLAGRILGCMERAANAKAAEYSRYGSTVHKQVYIYGGLDRSPTTLRRSFGMAWGIGGWLLMPFLERVGPEAAQELRLRVAREVKTTFASHYAGELSLAEALNLGSIEVYGQQATGEKYLINPSL